MSRVYSHGDQIGGFFCQFGYFWKLRIFEKMKYLKEMATIWATFCLVIVFYIFYLNR
jgi:hypothetical protein